MESVILFFKSHIFFSILFCVVLIFLFFIVYKLGKNVGKLVTQKNQAKLLETERADAVKRSRAVIGGQLYEQIAPLLPDFPCKHEDVRFIGKPIDFVGFVGMSDSEEKENISEILFIEVKTGNSQLSAREKQIKKAVEEKRVRYVEYRIE